MYSLMLAIQIIALLTNFTVILVLLVKKPFRGQAIFLALCAAVLVQCFGYTLEITSTTLDSAMMSIKIQYLGSAYVNILFLSFLFDYCKLKKSRLLFCLLFLINTLILIAVVTCEYHPYYYTDVQFVQEGSFPHVIFTKGILYHLFKSEVLLINFMILFIVISHYFRQGKERRRQELNFVGACLFPSVTCASYFMSFFKEYDPSSASFVISGLLVLIAIYRHQLFDIIHTARDSVIEVMDEALVVVDADFHLLDFNPAAKKLFPELKIEVLNSPLNKLSNELDCLFHQNQIYEFQKENRTYNAHLNKIYYNDDIVGHSAWIFDITESNNYMKNLIEMREQAEKANSAKSIFLAHMSHEIRTPLNAIIGLTDILLHKDTDFELHNDILNIKHAGGTLLSLINDVLDLTKIESGKLTLVDEPYKLTSVVHEVINIIGVKLMSKPVSLQVSISDQIPKYFYGDELRLRQVLINLMNNAVKFTERGTISLQVELSSFDLDTQTAQLIFHVRDTGLGIAKDDQKRIFHSFEQGSVGSDVLVEGSGLGLTICKRIIESAGGAIKVKSELGVGSDFSFTLPQKVYSQDQLNSSSTLKPGAIYKITPPFTAPNVKALVVDDNRLNLKVASGLLKLFDISVTVALSGAECLKLIQKETYQIIFLDHMMPQMDGLETLREIRSLSSVYYQTVPVIALTANAISGNKEMFLTSGFNDYLSKPIAISHLEALLKRWLPSSLVKLQGSKISEPLYQEVADFDNIDYQSGLVNCANQTDVYLAAVKQFLHDAGTTTEQLANAKDVGDALLFTTVVHGLKSAAKTLGAIELSRISLKLEESGHKQCFDEIEELYPSFKAEYQNAISSFTNFIKEYS
ncbi:histidine kinase N-terminal 7TM domain-containing protein [Lachnoclostridium phytofermentans]|uniref:Circadian input-output histidine kinase CikA n=1 Tax=Lachnoclostridium phytofermentans (strain ATCC 700394 / DSM 18823 / ISDg) TaxID=357809 RepID=A9KP28_LACP7|nr:histidine kinase N-terminal 7TM domain-containing protein [Lachnoclostridium phytofermentans]ABX43198.1 multi-sensor hybrid histidine kinase [Lachnoclostridium phytofermentans ISDg]